jgi:hypothetical protein
MYSWVNGRSCFLVAVIGSCYRCILCWELALCKRAQEIAETIAVSLAQAPGKSPRLVRDNGSLFVAKEWLLSAVKYLRPRDYHGGNLEALPAGKERADRSRRWVGVGEQVGQFDRTSDGVVSF